MMNTRRFFLVAVVLAAAISVSSAQNYWQHTADISSLGGMNALCVDSSGNVFAGTEYGIYKSTDNGATWVLVDSGLTNTHIKCLAAGSGGNIFAGTRFGLFHSSDGGMTWFQNDSIMVNQYVHSLAIGSTGTVFAGSDSTILRSTDGGATWAYSDSNIYFPSRVIQVAAGPSGVTLALLQYSDMYLSTDDGVSWNETYISSKLPYPSNIGTVAIDGSGNFLIGAGHYGIFKSTDQGNSFTATGRQTGITISTLSADTLEPLRLLHVAATGLDTSAEMTSVKFFDASGFIVEVPVVGMDSTGVTVAVPPHVDPYSGNPDSGVVSVQVLQRSGISVNSSNAYDNFTIGPLPNTQSRPGALTFAYLTGLRDFAVFLQDSIQSSDLNSPPLDSSLAYQIANLNYLIATLNPDHVDSMGNISFGSVAGNYLYIDTTSLRISDQMLLALLDAQSNSGSYANRISGLIRSRLLTTTPCGVQPANDVDQMWRSLQNPNPGQTQPPLNTLNRSAVDCTPDAINTAYKVVAGSGAVAIGLMALAGVSVAYLALPAAAILYLTVSLNGGMIGIGGALGQASDEGKKLVQIGVENTDKFLKTTVRNWIVPEAVGTIADLASGVDDLHEAFSSAPPNAPGVYYTYTGSVSGSVVDQGAGGCEGTATVTGTAVVNVAQLADGGYSYSGSINIVQGSGICEDYSGSYPFNGTVASITSANVGFTSGIAGVSASFSGTTFSGSFTFSVSVGPDVAAVGFTATRASANHAYTLLRRKSVPLILKEEVEKEAKKEVRRGRTR